MAASTDTAAMLADNLLEAVDQGNADTVRSLLSELSEDQRKSVLDRRHEACKSRTCSHVAAGRGHVDILRMLHEAQASMNLGDGYGETPLDLAVSRGHDDAAKFLEGVGAKRGPVE